MGKRLPAYQSHQARGLRRVTLLVPEACAMGLSSGRGPEVALLRRQPHSSLLTRRRREMDSNFWYRGTKAMDFRSIPGIARASAGSAWPIVR
jgi:hypothetical protein